jgi:hypothetical protein
VRLHAFEERLRRILQSFDKNGIIDPATGLLRADVFIRELERAISDARERTTGLSIARFAFRCRHGRARRRWTPHAWSAGWCAMSISAAATTTARFSIAFTETDLRHCPCDWRAASPACSSTPCSRPAEDAKRRRRSVTLATRKIADSVASLLARVTRHRLRPSDRRHRLRANPREARHAIIPL